MENSVELMLKTYESISVNDLLDFCLKAKKNRLCTISVTTGEMNYDVSGYETGIKNITLIATI